MRTDRIDLDANSKPSPENDTHTGLSQRPWLDPRERIIHDDNQRGAVDLLHRGLVPIAISQRRGTRQVGRSFAAQRQVRDATQWHFTFYSFHS